MTTPGGAAYSAGTIFLQVVPSFRNFQRDMQRASKEYDKAFAEGIGKSKAIEKALDKALTKGVKDAKPEEKGNRLAEEMARGIKRALDGTFKNLTQTLRVTLDDKELEDDLKKLTARIAKLDKSIGTEITVAGAHKAQREIDLVADEIDRLRGYGQIDVRVEDNLKQATAALRKYNGELEKTIEKAEKPPPRTDNLAAAQKDLQKRLLMAQRMLAPIKLKVDPDLAEREIQIALIKLEAQLEKAGTIEFDVEGLREAEAEFRRFTSQIEAVDGKSIDIDTNLRSSKFVAEAAKMEMRVKRLDGQDIDINVDVDRSGLERLGAVVSGAQSATGALRGFNAMVLLVAASLPLLPALLGAAAGGLLALGAAAGAAGAGLGVAILGFSGLAPAIKAMNKVSEDGVEQQRALDKTTRAAAKGVREAQQRVGDAARNAAQSSEDAARRVAEAQQNVADAHKDSAKSIRRALQQVARAEDELADAQRNSKEAQDDLREARLRATDDLADHESKVKKGALDERQALIDLFDAQVEYNAAQKAGATNLEREQAAISLERARIALSDQRRENAELAKEQKRLNKEGVEGTDRVVNARERAAEAQERESDAARRVSEAQQGVEDARLQGAERIANAEKALADARRSQARQQVENMRSIQNANEALSDAQMNYRDQLLATTASADELRDAMNDLSPAGQRFAEFLFGLRGEFSKLRATAQEGMLPGVQRGIEALLPYGPQINSFVDTYARSMGRMFESTLKGLTTEPWREFFGMLEKDGPGIMESYGAGFGNLATAFAQMSTAFAPLAIKMADGFERITGALVDYFASQEGQDALERFMGFVERNGPLVIDFFAGLVKAVVNIGRALAPIGEVLLPILTGFLEFIADMDPGVLSAIVFGIIALVVAFQLVAGVLGIFSSVAGVVVGFANIVIPIFGTVTAAGLGMAALVVGALALFVLAFAFAYFKVEWFRKGVNAVFNAIWETIKFIVNLVIGVLKVLAGIIGWLWDNIVEPIFGAIASWIKFKIEVVLAIFDMLIKAIQMLGGWFGDLYDEYVKPYVDAIAGYLAEKLSPAFTAIVEAARNAWQDIKDFFSGGADFVVRIINDYVISPFNKLADFFGSKQITPIGDKPPPSKTTLSAPRSTSTRGGVQALATGGRVGGYSPSATADNIPAWLTAGEYVLPVHAVKRLRAAYGDQFLEWLRGGGGYAKGGLVEFGRLLQSRQFRVAEHPAFGGVRGRHAKNSLHYSGQAIDVNYGPGGTNAIEQRAIDAIVGLASEYGLRTIWRTAGHFNHAHFDTGRGGKGLLGKIGGGISSAFNWGKDKIGQAVEWVKDGPLSWFKNKALGGFGELGDTGFGGFALGLGKRVVDNALGGIAAIAGLAGDFLDDDPEAKPKLYDQGGWLPPGMSQIVNATGKPELILTPEQAEAVLRGGGQYQINVPMMPTNSTPAEVADAVLFAARRINRGGVYAGRG